MANAQKSEAGEYPPNVADQAAEAWPGCLGAVEGNLSLLIVEAAVPFSLSLSSQALLDGAF